jgi:hypothetical protein
MIEFGSSAANRSLLEGNQYPAGLSKAKLPMADGEFNKTSQPRSSIAAQSRSFST